MNAKTVLKKLVSLLKQEEVELTYAKLKDGTIVESETFDVGEPLFVIGEDGEKTPAPNGEHELALRDSEGNETLLKVITEDGKIVERENVELADLEVKEAEDIPATGPNELPHELSEETYETAPGDIPTTGDGIPADLEDTEEEDVAKIIKELSYRIEELEEEEEEDLPKLDGAPVEAKVKKLSAINTKKSTPGLSPQERVLARLYNK